MRGLSLVQHGAGLGDKGWDDRVIEAEHRSSGNCQQYSLGFLVTVIIEYTTTLYSNA